MFQLLLLFPKLNNELLPTMLSLFPEHFPSNDYMELVIISLQGTCVGVCLFSGKLSLAMVYSLL